MLNKDKNTEIPQFVQPDVSGSGFVEKELANWIYYEDDDIFYCSKCIEDRLQEIKEKDEFRDELGNDECGFHKDYSHHKEEVSCCKCSKQLFSLADC